MRRALSLTGALSIAALLAVGCGSSSSSSSTPPAPSTPASTAPAGSSASGGGATGSVQVKMANIQFSPQSSTVKVGQTVTWTNADQVEHNVTAMSGASFKSSNFGQGKTFTYKATKPGTIQYVCTIHPGMTATLTVVK